MGQLPRKSLAAKEQTIRLARMLTASTSITPKGFVVLCKTILRDSRSESFQAIYGEPPALPRTARSPNFDS